MTTLNDYFEGFGIKIASPEEKKQRQINYELWLESTYCDGRDGNFCGKNALKACKKVGISCSKSV